MASNGPYPVRFALLMPWGRVGSHLVMSGLQSAPGIDIANEPTTAMRTRGHAAGRSLEDIAEQQLTHLDTFGAVTGSSQRGLGLKLSYRSLVDRLSYLHRLQDLDYRIVVMTRDNFLKCAVSQLRALALANAAKTGPISWNSPWAVGSKEQKPGPTRIDADEAIRLSGVFKTFHERMMVDVTQVLGSEYLMVDYEMLQKSPERVIRNVFAFIGIEAPKSIALAYQKATSNDLTEDVVNYDEFAQAVKEAGLGQYLLDRAISRDDGSH